GRDEIAEVGMFFRRDDPVVELPRTVGRGGDQCGAHHLVPGGDAERRTHILFTSFRAGTSSFAPACPDMGRGCSRDHRRLREAVGSRTTITHGATICYPNVTESENHWEALFLSGYPPWSAPNPATSGRVRWRVGDSKIISLF